MHLLNQVLTTQDSFNDAFGRIVWVSYRKNFPAMQRSNKEDLTLSTYLLDPTQGKVKQITSDCGWGCMIRCMQMLLANSLKRVLQKSDEAILSLFLDAPSSRAPFGIHSICDQG